MPGERMLTGPVPSSGEEIGVVGLGTYRSFDTRLSPQKRANLTEVLDLLFGAGGSVIDSSPMYGRAESVVGELLQQMDAREKSWIATKVWTRGKEKGIRKMTGSLAKLRTGGIELMQVHNLVGCDDHLDTLRGWKAEGRIRYIGITHYTSSALEELMGYLKQGGIDFVQFPYSIVDRGAENGFLAQCADLGVATMVNRPLEQGGLLHRARGPLPGFAAEIGCRSWSEYFLKYLLADPAITCVIPATGNPDHMRENLRAGIGEMPDRDLRRRMAAHIHG